MRLPRFRIRTMMVVVLLIAAPLGICVERRSRFAVLAHYHSTEALRPEGVQVFMRHHEGFQISKHARRHFTTDKIQRLIRLGRWHRSLAPKYQFAARYPWL